MREHILIEPSGASVDFLRKCYDTTRVWFSSPRPLWIANLLPDAIKAAQSGSDLTFSSWRTFPLTDPELFTIPRDSNATVKVYCPVGGEFSPSLWCSLTWFDRARPPLLGKDRFHSSHGALGRVLNETLAKPEAVDQLRKLSSRQRYDVWVRHDWRIVDIIGADNVDMPNWMKAVRGLSPEMAAGKLNSLRAPTSASAYYAKVAADRAQREGSQGRARSARGSRRSPRSHAACRTCGVDHGGKAHAGEAQGANGEGHSK